MPDSLKRPDPASREAAPDVVDRFVAEFQAKRGLYIGGALGILALTVVVLLLADSGPGDGVDDFSPIWDAYAGVRERIRSNQAATEELAGLERQLASARGTDAEASALWLSAVARYGSAFTRDKLTSAQKLPLLEGAQANLQELKQARYDHFLPALSRWYTTSGTPPVEQLLERVTRDLEWLKSNAQTQPEPDAAPTAVLRTDIGDIHLRFFGALAPQHLANFVSQATKGSYNGTAFHFVRGGAQPVGIIGGDPYTYFYNDPLKKEHILRWGGGGAGFDLPPEESRFRIVHARAIVTAQRRQNADWDNASQFQILLDTDPALDRVYSPFAQVVEGLDVVEKIAKRKTASEHGPYKDDPLFQRLERDGLLVDPVWIQKVIVYGEDGNALEHAFELGDEEKTLAGLKGTTVNPLDEAALVCGRKLCPPGTMESYRSGLDFPFPDDIGDSSTADVHGDRRVIENVEPGGTARVPNGTEKKGAEGDESKKSDSEEDAATEPESEGDEPDEDAPEEDDPEDEESTADDPEEPGDDG